MNGLVVFALLNFPIIGFCQTACQPGWFGSLCQYKCRCQQNKCDPVSGQCLSDVRCVDKWFGPACQYRDLAQTSTVIDAASIRIVTDNNENTCLDPKSRTKTLVVKWSIPYQITWLRIVAQDSYAVRKVSVQFTTENSSETLNCPNLRTAEVSPEAIDIHCDFNTTVNRVIISGEGVASLCSVYVSGGRDVAIKQKTTQTSDLHTGHMSKAWKAVDGDRNGIYGVGSCTHTDMSDYTPQWNLTFSQSFAINSYALFNRDEGTFLLLRLKGFELRCFDDEDNEVFMYKDTNPNPQLIYEIATVIQPTPIKTVSIRSFRPDDPKGYITLTLCEVEVYGESICPPGRYGRDCENLCSCAKKDDMCFVSSGGCPSGCGPGFQGEDCKKPCDKGWFGLGCIYKCHCMSDTCNPVNGTCDFDDHCVIGWFGPACQYVDLMLETKMDDHHPLPSQIRDFLDHTCLHEEMTQLSVVWVRAFYFTFLRIVVKDSGSFDKISIQFRDANNSTTRNCTNLRTSLVNDNTLDIHCDVGVRVSQVIFLGRGVRSLCSVYVSGGRNVALKQQSKQSSTFYSSHLARSRNAVDGNKDGNYHIGSCTHTNVGDFRPKWSLLFAHNYTVIRYNLYNRDGDNYIIKRLQGFIISSLDQQGTEIFHYQDTHPTHQKSYAVIPNKPQNFVFAVNIQAISVDHEGAIYLSLCEVEIFGDIMCEPGRYGLECEKTCNCADKEEQCFASTGGCSSGCAAGFYGESCNQACDTRLQDTGCGFSCPQYCRMVDPHQLVCHHNRTCVQGCQPGYIGRTCYEQCENGTYGTDCSLTCSSFCGTDDASKLSCHHVNGTCYHGCLPGYTGPMCNEPCFGRSYGPDCKLLCPQFCSQQSSGPVCHNTEGTCYQGCEPGYAGPKCEETCGEGLYGQDCDSFCPSNCEMIDDTKALCHHIQGTCLEGCKPGYKGQFCNDSCDSGRYGQNCSFSCSEYCKMNDTNNTACDYIDGRCFLGCDHGYQGDKCDDKCESGLYGSDCSSLCPVYCNVSNSSEPICHHTYGVCLQGCLAGYQGETCVAPCEDGMYGDNCNSSCPEMCDMKTTEKPLCHNVIGECLQGCQAGFMGPFCNEKCESRKYGKDCNFSCHEFCENGGMEEPVCNAITGVCLHGCQSGYQGVFCNEKCESRKYGKDCNFSCPEFCENVGTEEPVCNAITGVCLRGCQSGYQGVFCNETKFENETGVTQKTSNSTQNGTCTQDCHDGSGEPKFSKSTGIIISTSVNHATLIVSLCVVVAIVAIIGVFVLWRRRSIRPTFLMFARDSIVRTESHENIIKTEMSDVDS